ncbi:MAG TPA: carboxypeptidase regulatory-like domain-containing protein [Polyangiaceae bacterium]|nr:carboxypeptidase regulatory-like domain-containing protein [Polyangiaceae bacterium]
MTAVHGARLLLALITALVSCGGETVDGAAGGRSNGTHRGGATGGSGATELDRPATGTGGTNENRDAGQGTGDVPGGLSIPPGLGNGEDFCQGLECQQATCSAGPCTQSGCAAGASTTLSGTVYDPSGKLPLYNVMVYVPNGKLRPFTSGASCESCALTMEKPLAAALTDTAGMFQLDNVPVGDDIPVVIQIGKWRRQIGVSIEPCVDNKLRNVDQTRLPRNKREGDIPLIAITTGGADSMECLPRRLGIDDEEFTTGSGEGRIHLYTGTEDREMNATSAFAPALNGGAELMPASALWASPESLGKYDVVMLSCEGFLDPKPRASREAMYAYTSRGGRVFASHWHHSWFSAGPGRVPDIATWEDRHNPRVSPSVATINTSFPKGQALSQWLVNVGAATTPGQMEIDEARDNAQAVNPMLATEWMTIQNDEYPLRPNAVEYLSFNAPLGAAPEMQCGRAVYTDLHVSSTGADVPGAPFPDGCEVRDLSSQEKAVAFMLFDLSACLIPDIEPPTPPPIIR